MNSYQVATHALVNYIVSGANTIDYTTSVKGCKYYKAVYKFINELPDVGTQERRIKRFKKIRVKFSRMLPPYLRTDSYSYDYTNNLIQLYGKYAITPVIEEQHCDQLLLSLILRQYYSRNYWVEFYVDNILEYIERNMGANYSGADVIDALYLAPPRYDIHLLRKYVALLVKVANRECRFRFNTLLNNPPFGTHYVSEMRKFTESIFVDDNYNYRLIRLAPRRGWCS